MKITGYIRTTAPIHISNGSERNLTTTATENVPDYETGYTVRVPVIPGSVLRGKLRRMASDMVIEAFAAHGATMPLEIFNALRHGSNSGRLQNEPLAPSFFDTQRAHPLMGLFGGGPRQGAAGALSLSTMYPHCAETLRHRIVPPIEEIATPLPAMRLTEEKNTYPRLDVTRESDEIFDEVVENLAEKIDEIQAADVQRRVKKAAEGSADEGEDAAPESSLRSSNIVSYRQMIQGVNLHLKARVDRRAADHVKGFLIVALIRLLETNTIGGMGRTGVGVDVFDLDSAAANLRVDGKQMLEYDGHTLRAAPGLAADLVAAYEAWSNGGKGWIREDMWKATGFHGIDLTKAATKKASPGKDKKGGKGK